MKCSLLRARQEYQWHVDKCNIFGLLPHNLSLEYSSLPTCPMNSFFHFHSHVLSRCFFKTLSLSSSQQILSSDSVWPEFPLFQLIHSSSSTVCQLFFVFCLCNIQNIVKISKTIQYRGVVKTNYAAACTLLILDIFPLSLGIFYVFSFKLQT